MMDNPIVIIGLVLAFGIVAPWIIRGIIFFRARDDLRGEEFQADQEILAIAAAEKARRTAKSIEPRHLTSLIHDGGVTLHQQIALAEPAGTVPAASTDREAWKHIGYVVRKVYRDGGFWSRGKPSCRLFAESGTELAVVTRPPHLNRRSFRNLLLLFTIVVASLAVAAASVYLYLPPEKNSSDVAGFIGLSGVWGVLLGGLILGPVSLATVPLRYLDVRSLAGDPLFHLVEQRSGIVEAQSGDGKPIACFYRIPWYKRFALQYTIKSPEGLPLGSISSLSEGNFWCIRRYGDHRDLALFERRGDKQDRWKPPAQMMNALMVRHPAADSFDGRILAAALLTVASRHRPLRSHGGDFLRGFHPVRRVVSYRTELFR